MSLVSAAGCAPCEARQAAILGWANSHGALLAIALVAIAVITLWPRSH